MLESLGSFPFLGFPRPSAAIPVSRRWGTAFAARGGSSASKALWRDFRSALSLAPAPEDVVAGVPPWLSPAGKAAERMARAGRFAWKLSRGLFAALICAHASFIAATSVLTLCYKWVDPPATVLMFYRRFENGYRIERPRPVSAKALGRRRIDMLVRVEDRFFYSHRGFDLAAIKYAWKLNEKWGRPISGASTISMQTARSLFLVPVKSYLRKYLEAIVTVELELILGKERILELYCQSAEWGKGLFGMQAASLRFYGAPVTAISDERYIRLVSLLPSPLRFTPNTLFNHRTLAWRYDYLAERYLPKPQADADPGSQAPALGNSSGAESTGGAMDAADGGEAAPGA